MTEAEQHQQQRPFSPLPEGRGTDRGDDHQRVDVETTAAQALPGLFDRKPAAGCIGAQEQSQ
jgi:hypothetical protein